MKKKKKVLLVSARLQRLGDLSSGGRRGGALCRLSRSTELWIEVLGMLLRRHWQQSCNPLHTRNTSVCPQQDPKKKTCGLAHSGCRSGTVLLPSGPLRASVIAPNEVLIGASVVYRYTTNNNNNDDDV